MNDTLYQALTFIIPLVIAIVFHEVAHGWTARALGDPTAHSLGRLSLNPLRHVDPVGTVILPGMLALAKAPIFGWARPVPVVKERLRNPRVGMMLVAAAGPGINLVMAALGAVVLGLLAGGDNAAPQPGSMMDFAVRNAVNFILVNVFLALFNLLPVPPFDGSHIVEGLLPGPLARAYGASRRWAFPVVLTLLVGLPMLSPSLDILGLLVRPPVEWLTGQYLSLAQAVAAR